MKALDQKDKKLLQAIELQARLGTSILAKKVGLSQEGVYYRLKRLEEKGIISGYMALLNFAKFGYTGYAVFSRFQNITPEKKQSILKQLQEHDHIYWIAEWGGKYDLSFALMAKNIIHFNKMFTEISTEYAEVLKDFTVSIRVELIQFPRKYFLEQKSVSSKAPYFGKDLQAEILDALDQEILRELGKNARISLLELAKKINKPASTITNRVKHLEKMQVIQGYASHVHCQAFGWESYQLFLNTHNLTEQNKKKLLSYCQLHSHIVYFIETVGKWNFEIIYEVENQKQLQDFIIDIRTVFAEIIADLESIILFNHYVKYNQYPL